MISSLHVEATEYESIRDELGRFRIWAGNVSAHGSGRRSLEYRLRDSSSLQSTVTMLLNELLQVLERLRTLAEDGTPESDMQDYEDQPGVALQASDDPTNQQESDGGEDDAALFGLESPSASPVDYILEEIHEIVTCLMRFSMALRNPARHDQLKQSIATTTKHFESFDIEHVKHKFPEACEYLQLRLGKAISKQRQYFKYREQHHAKLAEGLDSDDDEGERPSTIATSIEHSSVGMEITAAANMDTETQSVHTATSFALTTAGDSPLRRPALPDAGKDGEPFECPLCYGIIAAVDERSWR